MHAIQCVTTSRAISRVNAVHTTFAMEREMPDVWQFLLDTLASPKSPEVLEILRTAQLELKQKEFAGLTLSRRTREMNQEIVATLRRH